MQVIVERFGLFSRFDLLAVPSAQVWPFAADARWPEYFAGARVELLPKESPMLVQLGGGNEGG